jgi:sensor domain DACNV-containing protein
MPGPAYPAARVIAARVESHFARHLAAARERSEDDLAPPPDAAAVEAMLDAAFWASLRREETYSPTISLAFVSPDQVSRPLRFERRQRLVPGSLARLAPAVERPGIHLGVWHDGDELHVWGATRTLPALCFVLEVVAPGLLVVKHRRRQDAGKFVNVAVLEGDQIKIVDERGTIIPGCPPVLASLLGSDTAASPEDDSINVPMQLAVSMRAHQRGGALLLVLAGLTAVDGALFVRSPQSTSHSGRKRTFPVVFRPSNARWASAASGSGYSAPMRSFNSALATHVKISRARQRSSSREAT